MESAQNPVMPVITDLSQKPRKKFLLYLFVRVIFFLIFIYLATVVSIYFSVKKDVVTNDSSKVTKNIVSTNAPTTGNQVNTNFFISTINKSLEKIELLDLPNNAVIRSFVEYGDSFYTSGDGSIIRYSKLTGEIISFSDLRKANCDRNIVVIKNYLYAACRIDNVDDAFGGKVVSTTPYFSQHYGILKINLDTHNLEKTFTKSDGLINQYNYELHADGDYIWIETFNGLAKINTSNNEVLFFSEELGFPELNSGYNVVHVLVDKEYVWVFFGANAYSQGGVALYDKKTSLWRAFGLQDLKEKQDRFDLESGNNSYLAKLIEGGIQIASRDGNLGDFDRLVEKNYNYNTGIWEKVSQHIATGPESRKTNELMKKIYPSKGDFVEDPLGFSQINFIDKTHTINGRANYIISSIIKNKRYILTNATIDEISLNSPFRKNVVSFGKSLILGADFRDALEYESNIKFLIEPTLNLAIVISVPCENGGEGGCENEQDVWFIDLTTNKIKKVYDANNKLPTNAFFEGGGKLLYSDKILTIVSDSEEEIFEVDTQTGIFKPLLKQNSKELGL